MVPSGGGGRLVRAASRDATLTTLVPRNRGEGEDPDTAAAGRSGVSGIDTATIGDLARSHQITLHELTARFDALENVYTRMTGATVEYRGTVPTDALAGQE
jgi:hypothetical protein